MTETPTSQQLRHAMETDLPEGMYKMSEIWMEYIQDGSRWPQLLAKLHAMTYALAEEAERVADMLAAYAKAHPHGQLPDQPREVPVAGYTSEVWREVIMEALDAGLTPAQALQQRHRGQLAGQGPHTIIIVQPAGSQHDQAIVTFTDAQGRTALVIYYGLSYERMAAEFAECDQVGVPIPYIPSQAESFLSIAMPGRRPSLYDRFGRYISPDKSQDT